MKVMDKLSTITRDSNMEEITDEVTDMITKCISDVRKGKVPLEKMTFTTLLGADLQDYKVAVKQADVNKESLTWNLEGTNLARQSTQTR